MMKTTLISIRLNDELKRKLDELVERHPYFTRSFIINHLLSAVLDCTAGDGVWDILKSADPYDDKISIHVVTPYKISNR